MTYSIVIVDDHLLIAKAMSSIIEQFPHFTVLYEVENGLALKQKFEDPRNVPDIVLLDISMPVMDGFATAEWLNEAYPNVKVVALTVQSDESSVIKMIQAGASSYLTKNIHPADLEKTLEQVIENGYYYPDWATHKIMHAIQAGDHLQPKLTERETEFLTYVCTELTYKEIAAKMNCSPRTVESYRDTLFEKLNIKSRVGLALFAVKKGLHSL